MIASRVLQPFSGPKQIHPDGSTEETAANK
jgi:hypothetical protein